jgi:hypothetical protein
MENKEKKCIDFLKQLIDNIKLKFDLNSELIFDFVNDYFLVDIETHNNTLKKEVEVYLFTKNMDFIEKFPTYILIINWEGDKYRFEGKLLHTSKLDTHLCEISEEEQKNKSLASSIMKMRKDVLMKQIGLINGFNSSISEGNNKQLNSIVELLNLNQTNKEDLDDRFKNTRSEENNILMNTTVGPSDYSLPKSMELHFTPQSGIASFLSLLFTEKKRNTKKTQDVVLTQESELKGIDDGIQSAKDYSLAG